MNTPYVKYLLLTLIFTTTAIPATRNTTPTSKGEKITMSLADVKRLKKTILSSSEQTFVTWAPYKDSYCVPDMCELKITEGSKSTYLTISLRAINELTDLMTQAGKARKKQRKHGAKGELECRVKDCDFKFNEPLDKTLDADSVMKES